MKDNQTPYRYSPTVHYTSKSYRTSRRTSNQAPYTSKRASKLAKQTAYACLTIKERTSLADAISESIIGFTFAGQKAYLPGLGLFYPIEEEERFPSIIEGQLVISDKKTRSINFEKCDDESSLNSRENIVQWYDLASRIRNESARRNLIFPTIDECKAAVIEFISDLKREITLNGNSRMLGTLGQLCALHNRQGESEKAWFEGSDIFLANSINQLLESRSLKKVDPAVLESAWEPLQAAYGKPVSIFEIDLVNVLERLKFDTKQLQDNELGPTKIPVAAFLREEDNSVIFCTDGLRLLARRSESNKNEVFGTELTVHLSSADSETATSLSSSESWVSFQIALGWMLMQSTGSRTIKTGAAFSVNVPFSSNSKLNAIYGKELHLSPIPQQCSEGFFKYMSLTGITEDEFAAAEATSPCLLEAFLRRRGLLVETRINRSSVLRATALTPIFH